MQNININESYNYNVKLKYDSVTIGCKLSRATYRETDEFNNIINNMIERGYRKFIVDLYNVDFIDSTFMGSLIIKLREIKNIEGQLILSNLNRSVYTVIEYTRLNKIFEFS